MIGKESKNTGNVSLNEALGILEARKKERELTYEQQIALEHAEKFAATKTSEQKTRKALEDLGLVSRQTILAILNTMPKTEMLLKQILSGDKKSFADAEIKKIMAIVNPK